MIENEKFISIDEYFSENEFLVSKSLLFEKDEDDRFLGKIIDTGISYIPRTVRFRKAKKIMKRSLAKFIKKAKIVIDKFSKSFQKKVDKIDPEYQELKKKVNKLAEEGKEQEAKAIMETQLKELQDYKKEQMAILNKSIDDIYQAYTNAINRRIEAPGFVLNVELSEKGKGELKAKWEQLGALAKMKIDEHKTDLVKSKGWKRIDEIISEITAFIQSRKIAKVIDDADFLIQNIKDKGDKYSVKTYLRISGARLQTKEKGLLIGSDPELTMENATSIIKYMGNYRFTTAGWDDKIEKFDPDMWIRPYLLVKETKTPIYGDPTQIKTALVDSEKQNVSTTGTQQRNIEDEESTY